ncbi:MAG: DUF3263 domain-containing protein [Propionibacteriaceae bacterium]|jgi:hypothetical protein|nr:DUF3263 domain-containing protein [Propionibacteriaceae bacterium]
MTEQPEATDQGGRLSVDDIALLEFERRLWSRATVKEGAIRQRFGCSLARYYRRLGRLIDSPAALALDPSLVERLRRRRLAGRCRVG